MCEFKIYYEYVLSISLYQYVKCLKQDIKKICNNILYYKF